MEMLKINKFKIIDIIGILLIILLISFYSGSIIRLATIKDFILKPESNENTRKNLSSTIQEYAIVVDKNIFGIKGVSFSVIEKKNEQIQVLDTSGLKLKGVITLFPGYAFIENKDGSQMLFKLGDDVFNAGKLKLVREDYVYISQGNTGYKIYLDGLVVDNSKKQDNPSVTPNISRETSASSGLTFNREQIKKFLEEPREILTDARLLPNIVDGKQQGFVVREVKPNGFYDSIGLKNGDIILRANGIELTSPNDGIKIFNLLKELDKVELDIMRDGSRKSLVYYIN